MTKRTRRGALGLLAAGTALGAGLLAFSAWGSLSKQELEVRLLGLGKNRRLAELGLSRTPLKPGGDGGEPRPRLVHVSAQARVPDSRRLPVVLVHATPGTLFSWSELVAGGAGFEGLSARRDVHAIEIFGHGIAPTGSGPCSFERCARHVSAAIRALGLERVHLVGHSYGGEFCWRAALNDPELIASLTLMSSAGWQRRDQDWLPEERAMRGNPLAKLGWRLNSQARIETALGPHYRRIPADRAEELFLVCGNADNWKAMVDLARDENGERQDEIARIAAPTLVLWGRDDAAYPLDVYGRRFAEAIPTAELVALPDTGHYAHEERPAAVIAELERFFAEQEQP